MTNRLINELSPYLLQHAHNPVDWYPWGDEAFERAKKENKPVLVSIGYAACHWCHVMERESFESEQTAAFMNEYFINIKVDREERPEVDHLYMDAVQAINGSGGWPLNVFVTPDKAPFYGGTYYPPVQAFNRPSWLQLLSRINQLWNEQHQEVTAQSEQMLKHLRQVSEQGNGNAGLNPDKALCGQITEALLKQADTLLGGFGHAPKFPATMAISFLLEQYRFTGNKAALDHALLSLDKMMEGGIYDQLDGGFSRYSTDEQWLAPHFEKMLYDNALLILSYCDAYQVTKEEKYKRIIEETIIFCDNELKDKTGIYYSALDADSEGVEGKYYTWTWDEWITISGDKHNIAAEYFGVLEAGNWEHTNILHLAKPISEIAEEKGLTDTDVAAHIKQVKNNLFNHRAKRIRPATDDKGLLSWNALMNRALSKAGAVLNDDRHNNAAKAHMAAMLSCFSENGTFLHVYKQGQKAIPANLDDYAYLISAMLQIVSVTGQHELLLKADELTQIVLRDFSHETGNYFYYSSVKNQDIPVRKVDKYDGATPSANAVITENLFILGLCMEKSGYLEQARYQLSDMAAVVARHAYSFAYWGLLIQRYAMGIKTIICAGSGVDEVRKELSDHMLPHCYILTSKKEISDIPVLHHKFLQTETHIFVCTETACMPAVSDVHSVLRLVGV